MLMVLKFYSVVGIFQIEGVQLMTSEFIHSHNHCLQEVSFFCLKESHLNKQLPQQHGYYVCAVFETNILDFDGTHHLETQRQRHDQP